MYSPSDNERKSTNKREGRTHVLRGELIGRYIIKTEAVLVGPRGGVLCRRSGRGKVRVPLGTSVTPPGCVNISSIWKEKWVAKSIALDEVWPGEGENEECRRKTEKGQLGIALCGQSQLENKNKKKEKIAVRRERERGGGGGRVRERTRTKKH